MLSGSFDSLKRAENLRKAGSISDDVTMMVDEMYDEMRSQYHGGKYNVDYFDGELYSGICVLRIVSLQQSLPVVVKSCPETSLTETDLEGKQTTA